MEMTKYNTQIKNQNYMKKKEYGTISGAVVSGTVISD
jgi:hypothetical protein